MTSPRLMLADDHTFLVEAFRKLLEPQYEIVGTASDGRALLESAPQLNPDVIVADIGMPLMNGLEAGLRFEGTDADHEADFPDDERGPRSGRGSDALWRVWLSFEEFRS